MDQVEHTKSENKNGAVFVIVFLLLLVVAGIAGLAWYVRQKSIETSRDLQDISQSIKGIETRIVDHIENPNPNQVISGFGLYSIEFPDGWGEILRTTDSDLMLIRGTEQPVKKEGATPIVKDISGDGLVEPYVFAVQFYGNLVEPEGATISDFSIGKGAEKIIGKKFTNTYNEATDGRAEGDIDYQYRLPVRNGDSEGELIVFYHVYGSDPIDQVNLVDDIVRSISLRR